MSVLLCEEKVDLGRGNVITLQLYTDSSREEASERYAELNAKAKMMELEKYPKELQKSILNEVIKYMEDEITQ